MKKIYFIFFIPIILFSYETLWVRIFDQGAKEALSAICFDNQDNILITGGIWRGMRRKWNILFIKYTPNGELIWTREYDSGQSESAICIGMDREGNIIIGGVSGDDTIEAQYLVAKFSPEGNLIWRRDFRSGDLSSFFDLFIDENNNILLCGGSYWYAGGGQSVASLFKYDANGNLLWYRFYDWASWFYRILPLPDSSFLILGDVLDTTANSLNWRIFIVKFNLNGHPMWIKKYIGRNRCDYWAAGLALDQFGNIIVGGYELGRRNNYDNYDILLLKFTATGDTMWSKRLDFTSFDYIMDIEIDETGNIYAAGGVGKIDTFDYLLIKFNSEGETIWTTRYDNNDKNDEIGDLIIDRENNIIVTGTSRRYDLSDYDGLTIKYRGTEGINENFKQPFSFDTRFKINKLKQQYLILPNYVEKIEIYDVNGKLIKEDKGYKISLKGIKSGIYFLKVIAQQKLYIKKLIII
ncbi:MAG: T9SS type A sorting domain-containing protein [candidate division WOR-3 bacterium]|nr:T9SS type A sorting domain-containing protein [candidate division WOR-3 bacterium]MCX7836742.1 T9SS type A sorting domain-containing protein [candidate division WOR-3 bacterium]MDW8113935.1 T9SS type A sorting domain-containing protein [candidate division WOR-3 bacterium]